MLKDFIIAVLLILVFGIGMLLPDASVIGDCLNTHHGQVEREE